MNGSCILKSCYFNNLYILNLCIHKFFTVCKSMASDSFQICIGLNTNQILCAIKSIISNFCYAFHFNCLYLILVSIPRRRFLFTEVWNYTRACKFHAAITSLKFPSYSIKASRVLSYIIGIPVYETKLRPI